MMSNGKSINELLSGLICEEATLWVMAKDLDHLNKMWDNRITNDRIPMTKAQAKAVAVGQTAAYCMAVHLVAANNMDEMSILIKAYLDIKKQYKDKFI